MAKRSSAECKALQQPITSGRSPISPLSDRLDGNRRLKGTHSVRALCRLLNIRRSTFCHHELRALETFQIETADEAPKPPIQEIFQEGRGCSESRRILAKLTGQG